MPGLLTNLFGERRSGSTFVGLVGLLGSQHLIRKVEGDELINKHAEGEYIHLFCIYLCACVCVCVCALSTEAEDIAGSDTMKLKVS